MTHAEAIDHLRQALANAKPQCFVPVSARALGLLLDEFEAETEGEGDGDADAKR